MRLNPPPKCEAPEPFKGFPLKKLKVGSDLHCESPSQPLLELKPNSDQVGFRNHKNVARLFPSLLDLLAIMGEFLTHSSSIMLNQVVF